MVDYVSSGRSLMYSSDCESCLAAVQEEIYPGSHRNLRSIISRWLINVFYVYKNTENSPLAQSLRYMKFYIKIFYAVKFASLIGSNRYNINVVRLSNHSTV